jgi:LmbE family N-acetylglucosaminyl deacetylase
MRILAVGAHPDDVEFGCAPILIQEIRRSHEVKIVVMSRGEAASSGTPEGREQEARCAAALIGAKIEFLSYFLDRGGDCHIQYEPGGSIEFAREIRAFRPEVVLAPTIDENQHPDHASAGKMVRDGARIARYGGLKELQPMAKHAIANLYYYSITQAFTRPPDIVIDVTPSHERWIAAMKCHESQMATRDYVEMVSARARATGAGIGVDYAIGLWVNDPIRLESLGDIAQSSRHF